MGQCVLVVCILQARSSLIQPNGVFVELGCEFSCCFVQSLESLIITAILFGVTVKTLNKKPTPGGGGGGGREVLDERKKEKKNRKSVSSSKRHSSPGQVRKKREIVTSRNWAGY